MIYAVTCNPALDWTVRLDAFDQGTINRAFDNALSMGGKGVNVVSMLTSLGVPACAWGFVAGDTGAVLEVGLKRRGVSCDFITLSQGLTRINVKLKIHEGAPGCSLTSAECASTESIGTECANACPTSTSPASFGDVLSETEINGVGPQATEADIDALRAKVATLNSEDMLVLSGSAIKGCSDQLYFDLATIARERGALCVIDAHGSLLRNALAARPFLIKPNNHELAELFGKETLPEEELERYAIELAGQTEGFVLVSSGAAGAFLAGANGVVARAKAPQGTLVNSVGAGDSMLAGFLAGWLGYASAEGAQGQNPLQALKVATAAGSATAFCEGIATGGDVYSLVDKVVVTPG